MAVRPRPMGSHQQSIIDTSRLTVVARDAGSFHASRSARWTRRAVPLSVAVLRRCLALMLFVLMSSSARAQEPVSDPSVLQDPHAGTAGRALSDGGRVGIALLGGGAALAASTAAATSLIEAVSRNDLNANAPPKNPELVQVSGFITVSLLSASVGVMLLGGAMLANDLTD